MFWSGYQVTHEYFWQNFPNDPDLKSHTDYGTFIYTKPGGFENIFNNAIIHLESLFGKAFVESLDKESIRKEVYEFVEFHEYGHNLYVPNASVKLEESKPSLFHMLKLYDDLETWKTTKVDIKNIIDALLVDSMRDVERQDKTEYEKYVLYTKHVLTTFFETWILTWWKNDRLIIDYSSEKYKKLLEKLVWNLDGGNTQVETRFLWDIEPLFVVREEDIVEWKETKESKQTRAKNIEGFVKTMMEQNSFLHNIRLFYAIKNENRRAEMIEWVVIYINSQSKTHMHKMSTQMKIWNN